MFFAFMLAQWRALFISAYLSRNVFPAELSLWLLICAWIIHDLFQRSLLKPYFVVWRRNGMVVLFILFALSSLFWTIDPASTIFCLTAMIGASLVAAYAGLRSDLRDLLEMLAGIFAIEVLLNFIMIFVFPDFGIMSNRPYVGSWRGIFWHRNYLGSAMALANLIFLYRLADGISMRSKWKTLFASILYVLSFVLILMSRSATAMILFVLLQGAFLVVWVWVKTNARLRLSHYWVLGITAIVLIALALFKLEFIFGLLGRNTSLTGRVPLWLYLLTDVLMQKPVLGYGFAALWAQHSFRAQVQTVLGWGYPVLTADNGFLDVLLSLGFIGLAIFACTLAYTAIQYFRHAISQPTLVSCMPVLFLVYLLIANISLSHFFEIESFTWMVLVIFLFSITQTHIK